MGERRWEVLTRRKNLSDSITLREIIDILAKNRGFTTPEQVKEFFNPTKPINIPIEGVGISKREIKKSVKRLKEAFDNKEKTLVYADYDADGVTAAAIMWEALFSVGINSVPYIPERFSEGYGLNPGSIEKIHKEHPDLGLIITVDNGIVAFEGIEKAKSYGIDVIVTDHHEALQQLPECFSVIHTTKTSGSAVSWFFVREILKEIKQTGKRRVDVEELSGLAAIGTIADQLPLIGINRSIVKHGLIELSKTRRAGIVALCKDSAVKQNTISPYEVGFVIAPRINAMGRMSHAIDSLRLICTPNISRAESLAGLLSRTNLERQKTVEEVTLEAKGRVSTDKSGIIVISSTSYHEGVIGLAASRIVEEHYRPAIVLSENGKVAKGSARSVAGFNIIEAIRSASDLILEGGGHSMAAGFTIEVSKISEFTKRIKDYSLSLLTEEVLSRSLKVDVEIGFRSLDWGLIDKLEQFSPTGSGNPTPTFATYEVKVLDARALGKDNKHLKLKLQNEGKVYDGVAFGLGELVNKLNGNSEVDILYCFERNVWNGTESMQLKIKDIKYEQTTRR